MKEPQIVPVTDQCAYFELFSNDYVILFEAVSYTHLDVYKRQEDT